ncbi:SH3 domain-containing protein [Candidatus Pelagibacter sp.]|nr:SH3 domain-containing protein [Candidatus Pelagibacter sp.]
MLFKKPSSFAKPLARIEKGRLLIVNKCQEKWCKIKSGDYEGWIKTNDIWGLIN